MDEYSTESIQRLVDEQGIASASELQRALNLNVSVRTVQREIRRRGINLNSRCLSRDEVDAVVRDSVQRLGPVYGRKTTTGYLRSRGYRIGEGRVGDALRRLAPIPHRSRQLGTSRQVNPLTYYAPHFGYNVHVDQNEKLVDFGCVIVAAVDGASCFVVDFIVMPHKNAVTIYSDLYVPMTRQYGLFECLVSDHGREFALVQFIQAELAINRIYEDGTASTRPPYKQIRSTENNRVERIWVMVNDRCTIPIKTILTDFVERGLLNMNDGFTMFSVSYIAQKTAGVLLNRLKDSWNHHSIPRHGRPVDKVVAGKTFRCEVPSCDDATRLFMESGGQLTAPWEFGTDLVLDEEMRRLRNERFLSRLPGQSFEVLADSVLEDRGSPMMEAIQTFFAVTSEIVNA